MFGLRKKNFVRFYTKHKGVKSLYPVIKSKDLKRDWLKKLSDEYKEEIEKTKTKSKCPLRGITSTSKCPGIKNIINTGYIITCPTDIKIETNGDGNTIHWSAMTGFDTGDFPSQPFISTHGPQQLTDHVETPDNFLKTIIKINTPWKIQCSKDIVLLICPPLYYSESRFTPVFGILDPLEAPSVNIFLNWHVMNGIEIIKAGTPLAQYIPIPRYFFPELIVNDATEKDKETYDIITYAANHSIFVDHKSIRKNLEIHLDNF